jgi:branched-chain amino acid transport system ATP-binding protein
MSAAPVLRCSGIRFQAAGLQILDGIDFAVEPGEICGIVGPNGSGKSTFLNVVSGFVKPNEGEVVLDGTDVTTTSPYRRARAGLGRTFQLVRVIETATASENVEAGLLLREGRTHLLSALGLGSRRRSARQIGHALESVHADEFADWPARYLSFGTRRKIEIARAIVSRPKVLLVDEPTSGVSRAHIFEIERVLRQQAESGCAVVVVDHNLEFIGKITRRVVVFDAGVEVFQGTPEAAFADPHVVEAYLGKTA